MLHPGGFYNCFSNTVFLVVELNEYPTCIPSNSGSGRIGSQCVDGCRIRQFQLNQLSASCSRLVPWICNYAKLFDHLYCPDDCLDYVGYPELLLWLSGVERDVFPTIIPFAHF